MIICDFRLKNKQELQKYGKIILDFSYFDNTIEIENQIEANPVRKFLFIYIFFIYNLIILFNLRF